MEINIEANRSESNRIKILYICGEADIAGGGQRSFLALLKNLDKRVFLPVVILPGPGLMLKLIRGMNVPVEFLELGPFKPWRFISVIKTINKLRAILNKYSVKLVHVDSPRSFLYACWGKQTRRLIFHARLSERNGFLDRLADKYLYRSKCDKIIAVSEAAAGRFDNNKINKVVVIANGIDKEFIDTPRKSKDSNGVTVGYAGQIWSKKGSVDFLKMAGLVLKHFPQTRFLIAGKGRINEESILLNWIKRLDLSRDVQWMGFQEEMLFFYDSLDIFVYPSKYGEGIPRAVMEAMARGCAVVATDTGGTGELVVSGKNGLLVLPGNVNALTQAVIRLINSKDERLRLGIDAREWIKKHFTADLMTSRIEAVYKDILASS